MTLGQNGQNQHEEIILENEQKNHVYSIINIFEEWPAVLNYAERGTGKTIDAFFLSKFYKIPLFIICEKSSINEKEVLAKKYGIKIEKMLGYEELRGNVNSVLSH